MLEASHKQCREVFMRKKKNIQPCNLQPCNLPECDDGQSKSDNEMIDLLKNIVNQNSQVIELLTKLKERFI